MVPKPQCTPCLLRAGRVCLAAWSLRAVIIHKYLHVELSFSLFTIEIHGLSRGSAPLVLPLTSLMYCNRIAQPNHAGVLTGRRTGGRRRGHGPGISLLHPKGVDQYERTIFDRTSEALGAEAHAHAIPLSVVIHTCVAERDKACLTRRSTPQKVS